MSRLPIVSQETGWALTRPIGRCKLAVGETDRLVDDCGRAQSVDCSDWRTECRPVLGVMRSASPSCGTPYHDISSVVVDSAVRDILAVLPVTAAAVGCIYAFQIEVSTSLTGLIAITLDLASLAFVADPISI